MSEGTIRVGVAGWDYPDWQGLVYPPGTRREDRLRLLARYLDVVEINSTFYRPVGPATAAAWVRRTRHAPRFRFAAKAHRSWTHDPTPDLAGAVRATLRGLAPLREAGVLSALLVQFPQSFHASTESWGRLEAVLEHSRGWPVAVEFRHRSWGAPEIEDRLRRAQAAWCAVDQPAVGFATLGLLPRVTAPLAYLRLHGRNAANWFREGAGRDARYDYLYSRSEVASLAGTARSLAARAAEVVVVQNNHFRGQAVVNALQMAGALSGTRVRAPAPLVDAYPDLEEVADPDRETLF